jgi:Cytochrome c554 and c-prime
MRRALLSILLVTGFPLRAQVPATIADQLSSKEHLAQPGWWPRKAGPARKDYVGPQACAECHATLAAGQQQHAMAHTAMLPADDPDLPEKASYEQGPFKYQIIKEGNTVTYSVDGNGEKFSVPVLWVFGSGSRGQSFLFRHDGSFYEARISFFRSFGFQITPDHPAGIPESLEKAIGRPIPAEEAPLCFGCHTTAANTGNHFDPEHFMPGISCEGCHGPGAAHIAAASAGAGENPGMILNPARLNPATSVDFCGSCHRTWWDINELPYRGVRNARFPAYRLEGSKCWGNGDARITCIACHNPHQPLVRDMAAYDGKCLSCHVTAENSKLANHPGRACPVATSNCASCHMPKYTVPQMRTKFTDHQIRIVKDSDTFPD